MREITNLSVNAREAQDEMVGKNSANFDRLKILFLLMHSLFYSCLLMCAV